jgi:hypothetical protein
MFCGGMFARVLDYFGSRDHRSRDHRTSGRPSHPSVRIFDTPMIIRRGDIVVVGANETAAIRTLVTIKSGGMLCVVNCGVLHIERTGILLCESGALYHVDDTARVLTHRIPNVLVM